MVLNSEAMLAFDEPPEGLEGGLWLDFLALEMLGVATGGDCTPTLPELTFCN
jgi:hypothetical protein